MNVGLIGFGRLGKLLARHFAREHRLHVCDPRLDARAARRLGCAPVSFEEAARQDVVVLCVPIAAFEGAVRRLARHVRPGAVVVDTCSVKERPVAAMRRHLPRSVHILGTHPNFGPDSAADSLEGRVLVLCPARLPRALYARVKRGLARRGLVVVELTPAEHDRRMASSLALTHFIGRGLIAAGAKTTGVDTEGYKRLLRILETVGNDSRQLFFDMHRYNRFAAPVRRRFLSRLRALDRGLG
ncbi:MAG: prephenate dehydrogenase [Elusimicrobia bacterium]|nr:prephenate dehydrogenase [Elusimicrobiota bacterium]